MGVVKNTDVVQKDLFKNLNESAKESIAIIETLETKFKELAKVVAVLMEAEVVDLKSLKQRETAVKAANEVSKETEKLLKQRISLEDKLKESTTDAALDVAKLRIQNQQQNKVLKEQAKESLKLVTTYDRLSKELNTNRKRLKNWVLEGKTATKEFKKLSKEVDKLDKELKDADATAGQFQRNVGNYPKVMNEAGTSLVALAASVASVGGAIALTTAAMEANAEGSKELRSAQAQAEAVTGVLATKLGGVVKNAIDLTKEFAKGNIELGVYLTLLKVGVGGGAIVATEDLGDAVLDAADAADEASDANFDLLRSQLPLLQTVADLTAEIEKQNALAGDSTRSFNQIEAAINAANKAEIERAKILRDIAQEQLRIIEVQIAGQAVGANTIKLDTERAEKLIELTELEGALAVATLEANKARSENARDRFEIELDFAIDAFDTIKTLNERIIADDAETLTARTAILQRTTQLADNSFADQIKLVEDFTGERLKLNELVLLDDQEIIRERLRQFTLDEITQTRILEIIRERKIAVQDLAEANRGLSEEIKENAQAQVDAINQIEQVQFERLIARNDRKLESEELLGQERLSLIEENFELQESQLIAQAEFEITLEKATAEQKELVAQQLINDLEALERERVDTVKEANEEIRKDNEETAKEGAKLLNEQIQVLIDANNKRSEERLTAIDEEIADSERREDELRRIAEGGSADATENLAFEQRKQAELAEKKEKEIKRQQNTALVLGAIESYSAKTAAGDENALGNTLAEIAQLKIAIAALDFFYEGTDDTGKAQGALDANGGRLAVLHDNEQVWSKKDRSDVGNRSRGELKEIVRLHDSDIIDQVGSPQLDAHRFISNESLLSEVSKMVHAQQLTNEAIKDLPSKMPIQSKDWDAESNALVHGLKTGNRFIRDHETQGKLFAQ